MADSCKSVRPDSITDLFLLAPRTCGPLGVNDQADPNRTTALGDTPGPLGVNDHADPSLGSIFDYAGSIAGSVVRSAEGIPVAVGIAVDKMKQTATDAENEAGYQFFAAFFDHYMPKKFIHHYVYGKGDQLTLTKQEMIDLNPAISVDHSKTLNAVLAELALVKSKGMGGTMQRQVEFQLLAGAMTNGTLGQFTVKMKGNLIYKAKDDWSLSGTMSFYDEWDFDPKDFKTGGRTVSGELKTRFAHHTLPGQGFKIYSEEVPFSQTSSDAMITWDGGTPKPRYDRVGQADSAIGKLDKS